MGIFPRKKLYANVHEKIPMFFWATLYVALEKRSVTCGVDLGQEFFAEHS
jgi:hypothetical protein